MLKADFDDFRRAAARPAFSRCFIKPSSPAASVVIASHNPGFDKWLNEMRVTMRKTRLPADPVAFLLFLLLFTVPAGAFGV